MLCCWDLLPLIAVGFARAPRLIRRAGLALIPYCALLLVIGYWWEIRYWMTTLPVLIPALASQLAALRAEA